MIDLDTVEKTILMMKKYGIHSIEMKDLRLVMGYDMPSDPKPPVFEDNAVNELPQEAVHFMQQAQQIQETALASSDEDILMNPYHGLDEINHTSANKEKGQ